MLSNFELSLGHNIMTSEYVLGRLCQEIAKNVPQKCKCTDFQHFLGGFIATRP